MNTVFCRPAVNAFISKAPYDKAFFTTKTYFTCQTLYSYLK